MVYNCQVLTSYVRSLVALSSLPFPGDTSFYKSHPSSAQYLMRYPRMTLH